MRSGEAALTIRSAVSDEADRLLITDARAVGVARGTATPEQRKIAKKQRCFIALEEPYYPTVGDMKEAINWLADRGFGKAPQTIPIESDQPTGYPVELRKWPPGIDPVAQGDGGIDRKAKDVPGGSSNDERIVRRPWLPPDLRDIG